MSGLLGGDDGEGEGVGVSGGTGDGERGGWGFWEVQVMVSEAGWGFRRYR